MEQHGLVPLGAAETDLLRALDQTFENWGRADGAVAVIAPPLLPVESLAKLDYYQNFPHQALVVSGLDLDRRPEGDAARGIRSFPAEQLQDAELALPSAACYGVYLGLAGTEVADGTLLTVLGRCFRKEDKYHELRRLVGFHMREVVAIGSAEFVDAHLDRGSRRVLAFAEALDLPLRKEAATDPFFDGEGSRALLQRLSPVKYEFIWGDMAIASVNKHRNFFGERCDIRLPQGGGPVFTSCVAFGLERWISALTERYGSCAEATAAVTAATATVE